MISESMNVIEIWCPENYVPFKEHWTDAVLTLAGFCKFPKEMAVLSYFGEFLIIVYFCALP